MFSVKGKAINFDDITFEDGNIYRYVNCYIPDSNEIVKVRVDKVMAVPFGIDVDINVSLKGKYVKYSFGKEG